MQARSIRRSQRANVAERRSPSCVKGPRAQEIAKRARARVRAKARSRPNRASTERVQELVDAQAREPVAARPGARAARQRRRNGQAAAARLNLLLEGTRVEELEQAEAVAQASAGGARRSADERGALCRQSAARRTHRSHAVQARRTAAAGSAADRHARGRHALCSRVRARAAAHAVPAGYAHARTRRRRATAISRRRSLRLRGSCVHAVLRADAGRSLAALAISPRSISMSAQAANAADRRAGAGDAWRTATQ